MGTLFAPLLSTLASIFSPVHLVFQYVFFQPVFNVLMLVYWVVHNFALSIVILTLLIRSSLIPLTRRQLRSSKVMQELAPQINELKAQYKDDPQGMMAAQQALYKENGVSLYGGCLPLLVQLPFLYALYYSFFAVLNSQNVTSIVKGHSVTVPESIGAHIANINQYIYPFIPHLNALPATQFFWTSLAQPDPLHILPFLAGLLTFIQLRMSLPVRKPGPRAASAGPDPAASMQMMQYIMPVITFTIGLSFPAGLALYWCITTGFSAVQQYFISGWGSLFVGVPGMERFVPPPKNTTPTTNATMRARGLTPTNSTGATARSPRSTTANNITGSADAAPSAGGIGGFFRRLTASAAAAQATAEEAAAAKQAELEAQRAAARERAPSSGATATGGIAARDRRTRTPKAGPVLIKQPTTTTPANPTAAAPQKDEPPEIALAREAGGSVQGKVTLPEKAIARDAVGASAAGVSTSVAPTKRAPTSGSAPKNANGGAKSNGANGTRAAITAKNVQPSPRPRSQGGAGRPKGGR